MSGTLRNYQIKAIDAVLDSIRSGIRRMAVMLPTGGGKTVVFSHLIPRLRPSTPHRGTKTLVLAHKQELVYQAAKTLKRFNPDLRIEIDMSQLVPSPSADIIVASVPTLVRRSRRERYNPQEFKAIILDECHHATAVSWTNILKYFNASTPESEIYVIGFTATFERGDGKLLGEAFDKLVYQLSLEEMIKDKQLADIVFSTVGVKLDLSSVGIVKDDYHVKRLVEKLTNPEIVDSVAVAVMKLRQKLSLKSTLIFCVSVDQCKTLCAVLQSNGINAQYVTGETAKHEREAILEDFRNGVIPVLCNVQVFTEGTDIPSIDSIFLARPTRSRVLLTQMIGRGLRLCPGKTFCHIIDMADTVGTGISSVPQMLDIPLNKNLDGKRYSEIVQSKEEESEQREKLEGLLKKVKDLKLLGSVVDDIDIYMESKQGFSTLLESDLKTYENATKVNEEIRKSSLSWMRLEYDVWAYPCKSNFYVLRRSSYDDKVSFQAEVRSFASEAQQRASNYRCKNTVLEHKINKGTNLRQVLIEAETHYRQFGDSMAYYIGKNGLTDNQHNYLLRNLTSRAKIYHPSKFQNLSDALRSLDKTRASRLIFATKYSKQCLYVKWELARLLSEN